MSDELRNLIQEKQLQYKIIFIWKEYGLEN